MWWQQTIEKAVKDINLTIDFGWCDPMKFSITVNLRRGWSCPLKFKMIFLHVIFFRPTLVFSRLLVVLECLKTLQYHLNMMSEHDSFFVEKNISLYSSVSVPIHSLLVYLVFFVFLAGKLFLVRLLVFAWRTWSVQSYFYFLSLELLADHQF